MVITDYVFNLAFWSTFFFPFSNYFLFCRTLIWMRNSCFISLSRSSSVGQWTKKYERKYKYRTGRYTVKTFPLLIFEKPVLDFSLEVKKGKWKKNKLYHSKTTLPSTNRRRNDRMKEGRTNFISYGTAV